MNREEARKIGARIHATLNETIYRKLTLKEYMNLIKLINEVFQALPALHTKEDE